MNSIKVSVITYVKNDVSHIEKCLLSVLDQTLKDIELIIVDGGSTDGTVDIISKVALSDHRVRVLSADIGVGRQFNVGLKAARGKYIGICESDDFLCEDMYEREYEIAEKYELDFLQADFNNVYEVSGVMHSVLAHSYQDDSVYDRIICPSENEVMLKNGVSGFWSGIYRREFLLDNEIFMNETQGAAYQDAGFSFLTKIYAKRAWVMRDAFYKYRMDNVHSSTNDPKRMRAIMTEYDKLEERIRGGGLWGNYKEYYIKDRLLAAGWFYSILSDDTKKDYLSILYDDINSKVLSGEFSLEKLENYENSIVTAAKESIEALFGVLTPESNDDPMLDRFENEVYGIKDKEKVILFGAGKLGEKLWLFLAERGIFAAGFADNSPDKQGIEFCNTKVMQPEKIHETMGDCCWIIANLRHAEEIKSQLTEMGVNEKMILVCPGFGILQRMVPRVFY